MSRIEGHENSAYHNLKSVRGRRVAVLQVNMKSRTFMVFTDVETARIFCNLAATNLDRTAIKLKTFSEQRAQVPIKANQALASRCEIQPSWNASQ